MIKLGQSTLITENVFIGSMCMVHIKESVNCLVIILNCFLHFIKFIIHIIKKHSGGPSRRRRLLSEKKKSEIVYCVLENNSLGAERNLMGVQEVIT